MKLDVVRASRRNKVGKAPAAPPKGYAPPQQYYAGGFQQGYAQGSQGVVAFVGGGKHSAQAGKLDRIYIGDSRTRHIHLPVKMT